jgi:hypothetical protein
VVCQHGKEVDDQKLKVGDVNDNLRASSVCASIIISLPLCDGGFCDLSEQMT